MPSSGFILKLKNVNFQDKCKADGGICLFFWIRLRFFRIFCIISNNLRLIRNNDLRSWWMDIHGDYLRPNNHFCQYRLSKNDWNNLCRSTCQLFCFSQLFCPFQIQVFLCKVLIKFFSTEYRSAFKRQLRCFKKMSSTAVTRIGTTRVDQN